MRELTTNDILSANINNKTKHTVLHVFLIYKENFGGGQLQSDFSGNLFIKTKCDSHCATYPLGLCIPELKNDHDDYDLKYGSVHNEIEPTKHVDKSKFERTCDMKDVVKK